MQKVKTLKMYQITRSFTIVTIFIHLFTFRASKRQQMSTNKAKSDASVDFEELRLVLKVISSKKPEDLKANKTIHY